MESLEGQKSRIRDAVSSGLDDLECLLTEQLAQKLSERESLFLAIDSNRMYTDARLSGDIAFAAEKQEYIQEIETLRTKAATVGDLEDENAKLRAEIEAARERQARREANSGEGAEQAGDLHARATSTVPTEEYNRVKDELAKYERDYGRIVFAHNILKSRVQHYKNMTREWRAYVKDWVLRHPNRQAKFLPQDITKPAQSVPSHNPRLSSASSAPTPPAFPAGVTLSASDVSRSTSPQQRGPAGKKHSPSQSQLVASGHRRNLKALTDQIVATQTAIDNGHDANLEDLTESDESEVRPGTASSTTTPNSKVVESSNGATAMPADSGSSPIVVFERSLRRKRSTKICDEGIRVREDNHKTAAASKPRRVKIEISSTSPSPFAPNPRIGEPHDSLDLDDIGDPLTTPRKRQRIEHMRLRSSMLAPFVAPEHKEEMLDDMLETEHEEIESPVVKDEDGRQVYYANLAPSVGLAGDHPTNQNNEEQRSKSRRVEKRAQLRAHNDRVIGRRETAEQSPSGSTRSGASHIKSPSAHGYPTPATGGPARPRTPQGRREAEQRKAELASPVILQPTDPNTHILTRNNEGPAKRRCLPSRRDRGAAALPALAENGEDLASSDKHTDPSTAKKTSKVPDIHHRMGALLSEPSSAKDLPPLPLSKTSGELRGPAASRTPLARTDQHSRLKIFATPSTVPAKRPGSSESALNPKKPLDKGSKSARAAPRAPAAKPVFRKPPSLDDPPEIRPEHEPLRSRPMHRLRLDHFKPYPVRSDYAYHESVRKHDEKKALSGCKDKNCPRCKDIREFVENSGYANLSGQNTEEIDQRLMEDFVGGDRRRLSKMSGEEKKNILTEARVQHFANEFGKHRQHFDRARSPVGFWDTGFPTTQEDKENRRAAEVRAREKVEERYWEAIREGGRYIFADE